MSETTKDRFSERGDMSRPSLDLPNVRIGIEPVDEDRWAWVAKAVGIAAQGESLTKCLRNLADAIDVQEDLEMKVNKSPPAWWNWFFGPAERDDP